MGVDNKNWKKARMSETSEHEMTRTKKSSLPDIKPNNTIGWTTVARRKSRSDSNLLERIRKPVSLNQKKAISRMRLLSSDDRKLSMLSDVLMMNRRLTNKSFDEENLQLMADISVTSVDKDVL